VAIVFIPNKSAHDFSDAERFGELRFLTEGILKKYSTDILYRTLLDGMKDAEDHDYLVVSSLSILNSLASAIMARKFDHINYLIFRGGNYLERKIIFNTTDSP
jgi:hypothetical protein|tara:strand:+ start:1244 stop:1552 length:309 start_codon:yes stop_codon:yes gene_type:complete